MSLFISIVSLVNSVQQMIPPNLTIISNYFGFGGETSQLGFLTFLFTILSGISMLGFGYLADKITRKWLVLTGSLIYSIFSMLISIIPSGLAGYYYFLILMSFIGVGFGAIIPSIFSLIGDLIKQGDRSKGYSFFSIASLFGMVLGLVLGTVLGQSDWRFPYLVIGIIGLFNSFLIIFLKEPSRIGRDHEIFRGEDNIEYSYRIKKEDLKLIFKKKSNFWLIINFVDNLPTGIIIFLLYNFMLDFHNIPEGMTLMILAVIMLSNLVGTIIFGSIGDRKFKKGNKKARVQLAFFANIAPIPFVFGALLIPFYAPTNMSVSDLFGITESFIMILLFAIGLFINGAVNGSWYATIADINLPEHRGTILSIANFFDIIGKALGPLIGALIADSMGVQAGMLSSIVCWVLLPLFWISLLKNAVPDMLETEKIFNERIEKLKMKI